VAQVGSKLRLKSESVMDSETGGGAYSSTKAVVGMTTKVNKKTDYAETL